MPRYRSPEAFKQALDARIKKRAKERGMLFNRCRQLFLFDRFMVRAYDARPDDVILKGGFVMELRIQTPRTTKDVDVRIGGNLSEFVEELKQATAERGPDWLSFDISDDEEMTGDQIVYEGQRVKVQAKLGGKRYGDPFGLDISVADAVVVPIENIQGDDLITILDIEPVQHTIYPKETHVAEKLHALSYEWPDDRVNSRVKDLVDLGLFANRCEFQAEPLLRSITATFDFRATHEVPARTPLYPDGWDILYASMAKEHDLEWKSIDELQIDVEALLNPVLATGFSSEHWTPGDGWS